MKKSFGKKVLAMVLTILLAVGTLSITAYAGDIETEGQATPQSVTWEFDQTTGQLTILGTGAMDYYYRGKAPWYQYRTQITTVIIGNGVTSIGGNAFYGCTGITQVIIPSGVTNIGEGAFYECTGITQVIIPSGVTNIGDWAFYGCTGITQVIIPSSVTSIGGDAFCGCTGITKIIIPSGVKSIGESAFYGCSGLKTLQIMDSVTSIGRRAFYNCNSLEDITMPAGANYNCTSYDGTFVGCNGVKSVTLTGNGPMRDYFGEYMYTPWFISRNNNPKITISDGVTSIGRYAFYWCDALTELKLPDSVTKIEHSAFRKCSKLTKIELPDTVTLIWPYAFNDCYELTDVYYGGSLIDKEKIAIGENNDEIVNATWHYGSIEGLYSDVSKSDWFYDNVAFVYSRGIMKGMGGTDKFEPGSPLQREQFAIILYRLENSPSPVEYEPRFHDVPAGEWYTDPIIWAYKNGIITGYQSGFFGVGDSITREQFAVMLYRYAKNYKHLNIDPTSYANISTFLDSSQVSDWAYEAMSWAAGNGIISGKDNKTRLDPGGNAQRCECAAMIQRFMDKYGL